MGVFYVIQVSGSATMQVLWPLYYRHIAFDALIFVVSVLDPQLSIAKGWIRRIINEDELRGALIIVIINTFDQEEAELEQTLNSVATALALDETSSFLDNPDRFRWFVVNAKDGERDESWNKVIGWTTAVMHERYHSGGAGVPGPPRRVNVDPSYSPTETPALNQTQ